jgi:hypothetical protein
MTETTPAYITADGLTITEQQLEAEIRAKASETIGKHISEQLEAIGRYDEMLKGSTPWPLPYTFVS